VLSLLWLFSAAIRLSLPCQISCYTKLCGKSFLRFTLHVDKFVDRCSPKRSLRFHFPDPTAQAWTISRKLPTSTSVLPRLDPSRIPFIHPVPPSSNWTNSRVSFIKGVDVKALDVSCQKHRKQQRLPANSINPPRERPPRSRNQVTLMCSSRSPARISESSRRRT
jgi:hypothetical protein